MSNIYKVLSKKNMHLWQEKDTNTSQTDVSFSFIWRPWPNLLFLFWFGFVPRM